MASSDALGKGDLEVRHAAVVVGGRRLLDDVSLTLRAGEVSCVLGPNGAGKSTLLRVLAGALKPSAGNVVLAGKPLTAWSNGDLARRRAVLSQSTALTFPFRVEEVVRLGRSPHAGRCTREEDEAVMGEAMVAADVTHLRQRRYPTLSGGEQQRVQLARVLAQIMEPSGRCDGRWLLLDEPTASLDLAHQQHLLGLARRVAADGGSVLAVLHDLNLAAPIADSICLLKGGRIAAQGTVAATFTPKLIEDVFGTPATVVPHPKAPVPLVVPLAPRAAAP
ncbi:MAG: heme ABC transporter ATP-binding protein [Pseudomonadota bacterium]